MELIDLINVVEKYNSKDIEIIKRAYSFAENLHFGQKRQSGEDYITHPLNVAYILAEMQADTDTLCAALLHDTLEDTNTTKEEIAHIFNSEVANLVDGVTKISKLNFSCKQEQALANDRKIITGITNDVRIIIIKLADRLHNMRTLEYKSEFKQKENSLETIQIFVPFAYYIGAYRIKSELEDISLKYLHPNEYNDIKVMKNKIEISMNDILNEMLLNIKSVLCNKDIPNNVKIRTKNIYGIYRRLINGYKLSEIHDLYSMKIMVDNIDNCYRTLGVIHSKYYPINDKFKDYISNPKTNMYQSLHTTVFGPKDNLVQIQTRTFDMDKVASFGLTAYWNINGNKARNIMQDDLKKKFPFFESIIQIDSMFVDNYDFVYNAKNEIFSDKVYVYMSNGSVVELPKGSTIIDLAFKIKQSIGNTLVYAKVNDDYVGVDYVLKTKDRVSIITDEMSYGSHDNWENIAKTSYAKKKILEFKKK